MNTMTVNLHVLYCPIKINDTMMLNLHILCCPIKINDTMTLNLHMFCVVPLKSTFFLTVCVFGSCFRTLAVNFVSD